MKYAVIIKHPMRDYDYRVDIIEADVDAEFYQIIEACKREMLGPFEVIAVTDKVNMNRDISNTLTKVRNEPTSHVNTLIANLKDK